ncbi:MAG: molybdate ABC transporter substrate-binding protein, partial [Acidobacteria bacterium]|nr:molybdate ABC transporter substrate-binding protein [Acidobacteriota bacterium]
MRVGRALLAAWLLCATGGLARAAGAEEVRLLAAASLTDAVREIGVAWEAAGGARVQLQLGGSNELARQIEAGAPADLFLSADPAQMDRLDRAGRLAPGTRRDLLSNRLVVIVPSDVTSRIATPGDLAGSSVSRIALAQPDAVPAGVYARRWLERIDLWDRLRGKVVALDNVRSARAAVESGNVDAGVVYATDAAASRRVRVVYEVPEGDAPAIVYPGAVLADSE